MVDTVKIRLGDLVKHAAIYNHCRNNKDVITYDYIERNKNPYVNEYTDDPTPLFQYGMLIEHAEVEYCESKRKLERFKSHSRFNPSSHYTVRTFVNKSRNHIEWEFSIPKYFYGTNIIQAVRNPLERDFVLLRGSTDTLRYQRDHFFPRLLQFIEAFFAQEYPGIPIDWEEAEIRQIDISFNQVFRSKREALSYLEMQKMIRRKGDRERSNRYRNYETSIFFGSQPYKVEVYHKGAEYEQNDRKKHEKINKRFEKNGLPKVFNVEYFQGLADRILRYEVSLRNQKLSYLFNERIFRANSPSFQLMKELYNKLRGRKDREVFRDYNDIADIVEEYKRKKINGVEDTNAVDFIVYQFRHYKKNYDEALSDHEYYHGLSRFVMEMDRILNTTRKFYLAQSEEVQSIANTDRKSNISMFETFVHHKFDKQMFQVCFDFLHEFMQEFVVEKKNDLNTYIERVDAYNAQVERDNAINKIFRRKMRPKLDRNRMVMLLGFIENYSLDQAKKMLAPDLTVSNPKLAGLSDSDFELQRKKLKDSHDRLFRKYQTELKALGITKQTLNEGREIDAPLDFSAYYDDLNTNIGRWNITNTPYRVFSKK